MSKKNVAWFSGGVSSFIAAYLRKETLDAMFYIDIKDQHPDTMRFLHDCEKAMGMEIQILKSTKYVDVNDVIEKSRFINSAFGAKCTLEMKKKVRQEWEQKQEGELVYIWGYDSSEKRRADRLLESMPEYEHVFPLIDEYLSKEEVHGMLERLGIKRPAMYEMGYRNNNCIGCVKGGMGYWNKIRKDFPDVFAERARIERIIGHSCLKDVFLDELEPDRGRFEDEVLPDCGIMCEIAYDKVTV